MGDILKPNYLKKLERLHAEGKLKLTPGLFGLEVKHDDWCNIWKGGVCNCDPDLVLVTPNLTTKGSSVAGGG